MGQLCPVQTTVQVSLKTDVIGRRAEGLEQGDVGVQDRSGC